MLKRYSGNWNHVARLEKWLEIQHSKGYAFQKGKFGFAEFVKAAPQKVKYELKPFIKKHYIGIPNDDNRNTCGWNYVGDMHGLITKYRVYRSGEESAASCPDSEMQVRLSRKAWQCRRLGYGFICLILLWFLSAAIVYLTTPLNEFTTLHGLLLNLNRIETTSVTPRFLWMLRQQWYGALIGMVILCLAIIHCVISLYYCSGKKNPVSLHIVFRITCVVTVCLGAVLTFAFRSDAVCTEHVPDKFAQLCTALEIPQDSVCYEETGCSPAVRGYRMTACSYGSSPSVWVHELNLWTEKQAQRTLTSYLTEIEGEYAMTVKIDGCTWTILRGYLWTGQEEGYAAYSVEGKTLRYIHYIGEKTMEEFATAIEAIG